MLKFDIRHLHSLAFIQKLNLLVAKFLVLKKPTIILNYFLHFVLVETRDRILNCRPNLVPSAPEVWMSHRVGAEKQDCMRSGALFMLSDNC